MTTSHLNRKELRRPDVFQDKATPLFNYVSAHTKGLALAGLAVLLVITSVAVWSSAKTRKSAEANSAFFLVKKEFIEVSSKLIKDSADWQTTLAPQFEKVEKTVKEYKGTQAAFEALLLLGDTHYDHASYSKAASYYKQALENAPARGMKALAQQSLAYAYENDKQYDAAVAQLRLALQAGEKSIKGDVLMSLARNFALKGDKAKASEQYEQVIKDFPNSALAKSAEAQKNALR